MIERQIYDDIGERYALQRRPDPRISSAITHALGNAETVINVGAGTGSYEPQDRTVIAVEPSLTMIRQRGPGSAPVIQALAGNLPFDDATFDAGLAVLTIHHWDSRTRDYKNWFELFAGLLLS
jgi:ubiquinone/menaquinone biosynthesis C-methylase UbiE